MLRRLLPFALMLTAAGCASMNALLGDEPLPPARPHYTPDQQYQAGVLLYQKGEYDAARREWDHCLASSSPEHPAHLDCLVALEQLASPAGRP